MIKNLMNEPYFRVFSQAILCNEKLPQNPRKSAILRNKIGKVAKFFKSKEKKAMLRKNKIKLTES